MTTGDRVTTWSGRTGTLHAKTNLGGYRVWLIAFDDGEFEAEIEQRIYLLWSEADEPVVVRLKETT